MTAGTELLTDLVDQDELDDAVGEGLVRLQINADGDRILNYTEKAVYTRTWTPATRQCRGLIVAADGSIVARPWPKFFNYGEHAADALDLNAPVEVTDKMDGSLGILYFTRLGELAIATRGSFGSEQARHATAIFRARYQPAAFAADHAWTYLFEIIYPENRIVLDYGSMDDLVLLGAVHKGTGQTAGPLDAVCYWWPGPRTSVYPYPTLAAALAAAPRQNAEGLVVRYTAGPHRDTLVKIKQDDYVALHRIITGLTARHLWERLAVWDVHTKTSADIKRLAQTLRLDPTDIRGILDAGVNWRSEIERTAPEEFTNWISRTCATLAADCSAARAAVEEATKALGWTDRKTAAGLLAKHPQRGMVFAALDGKDYLAQAWLSVRPEAERPYAARSESVA